MTVLRTYYDPSKKRKPKEQYEVDFQGLAHGKYIRYHENGKIAMECTFKAGKLDGTLKEYYANGQLKTECQYDKGLLEGSFEQYRENGNKLLACWYHNNVLSGPYYEFHDAGLLGNAATRILCTFRNGKLEDSYTEYFKNGHVHRECTFRKGLLEGPLYVYDKDGEVVEEALYRSGVLSDETSGHKYWGAEYRVNGPKNIFGRQKPNYYEEGTREYKKKISKVIDRAPGHANRAKPAIPNKQVGDASPDEFDTRWLNTGRWKNGRD